MAVASIVVDSVAGSVAVATDASGALDGADGAPAFDADVVVVVVIDVAVIVSASCAANGATVNNVAANVSSDVAYGLYLYFFVLLHNFTKKSPP